MDNSELIFTYNMAQQNMAARGYTYDPYMEVNHQNIQRIIHEFNQWCNRIIPVMGKPEQGNLPPGKWYMVTVTTPDDKDEIYCREIHTKAMTYFKYAKFDVYYAVIEHSNIWHLHYIVRTGDYPKNAPRDLARTCNGHIVQISKKAKTLQLFNGLCNYVMKRTYSGDTTHHDTLIKHIEYQEGKGYVLLTTAPQN